MRSAARGCLLRFQPLRLSRTSKAVLEMLRTAAGCMVMGVSACLRSL